MKFDKKYFLFIYIVICNLFLSTYSFGQDTIKLTKKPEVILHSWYPEYKSSPNYKIGDSKIIMTLTPDFENTKLSNCIIELRTKSKFIDIKKTGKINPCQFVIKVNTTTQKTAEFEAWLLVENVTILIYEKNKWVNIKDIYPIEGNKIKIETIKVNLIK